MTAAELAELFGSAEEAQTRRLSELYRANEYLAFNTAALCLAAFNAPQRFPKTPKEAFPKNNGGWREAKNEIQNIARQLNKKERKNYDS